MKKQCVMKYWLNVQKNAENPNTCIRYSNKALTLVYDPFTTFEKKKTNISSRLNCISHFFLCKILNTNKNNRHKTVSQKIIIFVQNLLFTLINQHV